MTEDTSPLDIDPRRFKKAMIAYVAVAIVSITLWQVFRFQDLESQRAPFSEKAQRCEERLRLIAVAVRTFRSREGREPRDLDELEGLSPTTITDPWAGHEFAFEVSEGRFTVYSLGADAAVGGEEFNRDLSTREFDK